MNIFGVGLPELAVIGALGLLIFGPKRLPEMGRSLGKTLKGLQSASSEFEKEIQKAMTDPEENEKNTNPELDSKSEKNTSITDKNQVSNSSENSPIN